MNKILVTNMITDGAFVAALGSIQIKDEVGDPTG
jgi:hypothetical protein